MSKLELRKQQLAALREAAGITTDQEFARVLCMDQGHVSRILRGANFGKPFIEALLTTFGIEAFQELFALVDEKGTK